jgi:hypothetical protein
MQIRPNSWAITRQDEAALGLITKSAVAFSLSYAMRLSLPSAILFGLIFAIIFIISGSIARGLTNFFLSIAFTSVFSSVLYLFKIEIDRPLTVFLTTVLLSIALSRLTPKSPDETDRENHYFDSVAAIALVASAHLFHKLTNLERVKLFGMLLPEDNAAWIHASSGFVRFDASAGHVTSLQYGTSAFTSNLLSALSVPTKFLSSDTGPILSLANTANAYAFLLMALVFLSSSVCREIFHIQTESHAFRSVISNGKFVLIGIFSAISVGKIFINSGHLSLILSVVVFWAVIYQFRSSSGPTDLTTGAAKLWNSNLVILSAFTIGTVWFPLIPIAFLTIVCIVIKFVVVDKVSKFRRSKQPQIVFLVGNWFLFATIILAALTQLQIPTGYSVSSLVNVGSGGTLVPSVIGLSIALIGFLIAIETEGKNLILSIYLSLFPLGLLAYWVVSMSANPTTPGYSVEKFSLLIALVGLPLFLGFVFSFIEKISNFRVSSIFTPLLIAFSLATATWGINSFPRLAMVDKSSWTINYLSSLLNQSEFNPSAQLLCLSGDPSFDMTAYTCSRFGSALQFKEYSNNNLARRWRSQILETNIDPYNFAEGTIDFDVVAKINAYIGNGGHLIVVLSPGPFWQIEKRSERPWMQELPWSKINVIQ